MRLELHCHSTASDGLLSPAQLVALAHEHAIMTLALTDHDTIAGTDEATQAGNALGMRIIAGIEISAVFHNREVHVLGYGLHPDLETRAQLESLRGARVSRAQKILSKLAAIGMIVPFERVQAMAGDGMIGRPHIARAMHEAGLVASYEDAFNRYLAEGQPAHTPNDSLSPAQAVALIHRAGGCAVLAHPGFYNGPVEELVDHMLGESLDGIEAHYPEHNSQQTQSFLKLAQRHALILTGGSDFHRVFSDGTVTLGSMALPRGTLDTLNDRMHRYTSTQT